MAQETRTELKARFEAGDFPTEADFAALIDSAEVPATDGKWFEVEVYDWGIGSTPPLALQKAVPIPSDHTPLQMSAIIYESAPGADIFDAAAVGIIPQWRATERDILLLLSAGSYADTVFKDAANFTEKSPSTIRALVRYFTRV
jgi:hypothetical protein